MSVKKVRDVKQTTMSTFQRTRPTLDSEAMEATADIGDKMETVVFIDLKILSHCWKSSMACAWPCSKVDMSSTEWQHCNRMASESSESVNVTPAFFS